MHSWETKNGTNATMHTPPLTASRASTSSGTLRGLSVSARALEWEKITGGRATSRAAFIVRDGDVRQVDEHAEALHLGHDLAAEVGQAAAVRLVGGRVGPADVVVVGERQVADAEGVQGAEHAERAVDAVPALRAEQGRDLAGGERRVHVVGASARAGSGPGRRRSSGARGRPARRPRSRPRRPPGRPGRRPTRTGRRPRPPPGAVCRCGCSAPARSARPRPGRSRTSRGSPRAGRCARRSAGSG